MLPKLKNFFTLMLLFLCLGFPAWSADSNAIYADLLEKYVVDGRVNYKGFQQDEEKLDRYLEILSSTKVADLSTEEQFAFYINAYNAFTIKLILTRYPDIESIKDLGTLFSSPWKKKFIPLNGQAVSLDHIEHGVLRPVYKDPRVHFAVNCASRSCPPLLNQPYSPDRLDQQLNQQTRDFINSPDNFKIEGDTLFVSKIFKWFKEDFSDGAFTFISIHATGDLKRVIDQTPGTLKLAYLDYDWSLNH